MCGNNQNLINILSHVLVVKKKLMRSFEESGGDGSLLKNFKSKNTEKLFSSLSFYNYPPNNTYQSQLHPHSTLNSTAISVNFIESIPSDVKN